MGSKTSHCIVPFVFTLIYVLLILPCFVTSTLWGENLLILSLFCFICGPLWGSLLWPNVSLQCDRWFWHLLRRCKHFYPLNISFTNMKLATPSTLHGTLITQSRLIIACMTIVVCSHPLTTAMHLSKVPAMPKWWCAIWLPPYPLPIMPAMPKRWWEVWFASYA